MLTGFLQVIILFFSILLALEKSGFFSHIFISLSFLFIILDIAAILNIVVFIFLTSFNTLKTLRHLFALGLIKNTKCKKINKVCIIMYLLLQINTTKVLHTKIIYNKKFNNDDIKKLKKDFTMIEPKAV